MQSLKDCKLQVMAFESAVCCSVALLTGSDTFAVTGNLVQPTQAGMLLVSQECLMDLSDPGVLLHSAW